MQPTFCVVQIAFVCGSTERGAKRVQNGLTFDETDRLRTNQRPSVQPSKAVSVWLWWPGETLTASSVYK
jgi:hypothetical protein